MTPDQTEELLDLYVADELPEALRAHIETYLASHPDAAQDVQSLQAAVAQLRTAPVERPDGWFVERTLDRLLREHQEQAPPAPNFGGAR